MRRRACDGIAASILTLALLTPGSAWNCTGRPRTFDDVLSGWVSTNGRMNVTRPNLAARWAGFSETGEGDGPARAPPDVVLVSMQINKLKSVNTKEQTYTLDVWQRVIWHDARLTFDASCLQLDQLGAMGVSEGFADAIWKPDLYSRSATTRAEVEHSTIFVSPGGRVWWLRKMVWKLGCSMNFEHVPFDVHNCTMEIASFTNDKSEINLQFPSELPIQVASSVESVHQKTNETLDGPISPVCIRGGSVDFYLIGISGTASYMMGASGESLSVADASFLSYHFVFKRDPDFYIKFRLVPLLLLVSMAYLSFFISRAAVPARVSLVMVVFLTISGMINGALTDLPKSGGYVWLLDLEIIALLFIFGAVLEYGFVNYLTRIEARVDKAMASATKRLSDITPSPESDVPEDDADARTSTAKIAIEVVPIEVQQDREMRKTLGPVARALLRRGVGGKSRRRAPKMCIKDEHVDVFCRFTFLPAFIITLLFYVSRLPPTPMLVPFLDDACTGALA